MVSIKFPGDWKEEEEEDEHDAAYYFGIILGAVGF